VLRNTYGIPGVLAEASFFTNEKEESRLKTTAHNSKEAAAYLDALESFFAMDLSPISEKEIPARLPVFSVLQEAERMKPEALDWMQDYEEAQKLFKKKDSVSLQKAYDLFTRSARSFPDSYVAGKCHDYRARILIMMNKKNEALPVQIRTTEYYVNF
jgi:hypothetical protein